MFNITGFLNRLSIWKKITIPLMLAVSVFIVLIAIQISKAPPFGELYNNPEHFLDFYRAILVYSFISLSLFVLLCSLLILKLIFYLGTPQNLRKSSSNYLRPLSIVTLVGVSPVAACLGFTVFLFAETINLLSNKSTHDIVENYQVLYHKLDEHLKHQEAQIRQDALAAAKQLRTYFLTMPSYSRGLNEKLNEIVELHSLSGVMVIDSEFNVLGRSSMAFSMCFSTLSEGDILKASNNVVTSYDRSRHRMQGVVQIGRERLYLIIERDFNLLTSANAEIAAIFATIFKSPPSTSSPIHDFSKLFVNYLRERSATTD